MLRTRAYPCAKGGLVLYGWRQHFGLGSSPVDLSLTVSDRQHAFHARAHGGHLVTVTSRGVVLGFAKELQLFAALIDALVPNSVSQQGDEQSESDEACLEHVCHCDKIVTQVHYDCVISGFFDAWLQP